MNNEPVTHDQARALMHSLVRYMPLEKSAILLSYIAQQEREMRRLDWLSKHLPRLGVSMGEPQLVRIAKSQQIIGEGDTLRAAIDAAMQPADQKTEG